MYTSTNYVIAKQNAEVELSRAPATTCCHLGDLVVVVSCNKAAGCMVGFARTVRRALSLLSISPTPNGLVVADAPIHGQVRFPEGQRPM